MKSIGFFLCAVAVVFLGACTAGVQTGSDPPGGTAPPDNGVRVDDAEGIVAGLTLDQNLNEGSPVELFGDVQWVEGIDGMAMEFDSEGEYFLLPDSDTLDLTEQGTVEVWV
jgi:hypothetical protein